MEGYLDAVPTLHVSHPDFCTGLIQIQDRYLLCYKIPVMGDISSKDEPIFTRVALLPYEYATGAVRLQLM